MHVCDTCIFSVHVSPPTWLASNVSVSVCLFTRTVFLAIAMQSRQALLHTGILDVSDSMLSWEVMAQVKGEDGGGGGDTESSHSPQWPGHIIIIWHVYTYILAWVYINTHIFLCIMFVSPHVVHDTCTYTPLESLSSASQPWDDFTQMLQVWTHLQNDASSDDRESILQSNEENLWVEGASC